MNSLTYYICPLCVIRMTGGLPGVAVEALPQPTDNMACIEGESFGCAGSDDGVSEGDLTWAMRAAADAEIAASVADNWGVDDIPVDGVPQPQLLSTDSEERKRTPVYSGVMAYFPRAIAEVAKLSWIGNEKHNPGEPLHWAKDKSNDHLDCVARHLLDAGRVDPEDGILHDVKLAWRALANLEMYLERNGK